MKIKYFTFVMLLFCLLAGQGSYAQDDCDDDDDYEYYDDDDDTWDLGELDEVIIDNGSSDDFDWPADPEEPEDQFGDDDGDDDGGGDGGDDGDYGDTPSNIEIVCPNTCIEGFVQNEDCSCIKIAEDDCSEGKNKTYVPGNSLNYQIGDVITFNGPFYFSDLDKVRKNLFTETGTAAANLVNPEILQHGNYYEIKSLSYTWTAVSTKFNGGYIGGFEGKECPDKTSTTPPGFPTNTGTDYENTGAFNDIPDDEEDSQTQGNTPPDDCYQPCTTSKLTTSKIVVTKGEQKMCSCEENLAESDFVDIVNLIDLTPPDFRIEGNTVKIKSEDGTYKKPSELDPNSHFDGIELNRYAASLARELNDKNNFFYIGSRKATDPSSENQASTLSSVKFSDGTKGSVITLNSNGGYSKDLDNVNNFKSILKHEIFHVDDNILKTPDNLSTHIDVYINAMKHITFKDATRDYQIGTIRSLVRYILNMDKRTDTQRDYPVYEIKQKIDNFNNIAGLDFTFVIDPLDYNQKGTLDIKIRDRQNFNSLLPQIPYKIISDEN